MFANIKKTENIVLIENLLQLTVIIIVFFFEIQLT